MTETLLLDEFLPTYDHVISISEVFRAPPEEVFEAITNLNLFDIPVARVLLEARACRLGSSIPSRAAVARRWHRSRARSGSVTCPHGAGCCWGSGPAPRWSTATSARRGRPPGARRSMR